MEREDLGTPYTYTAISLRATCCCAAWRARFPRHPPSDELHLQNHWPKFDTSLSKQSFSSRTEDLGRCFWGRYVLLLTSLATCLFKYPISAWSKNDWVMQASWVSAPATSQSALLSRQTCCNPQVSRKAPTTRRTSWVHAEMCGLPAQLWKGRLTPVHLPTYRLWQAPPGIWGYSPAAAAVWQRHPFCSSQPTL